MNTSLSTTNDSQRTISLLGTLANSTSQSTATLFPIVGYTVIPISLIAIIGSIHCIMRLWADKKQNFSAKAIFMNLAIASFFTGVGLALLSYTSIVGSKNVLNSEHNSWACQGNIFLLLVGMKASPCTHATVALNRLFHVVLGNRYPALKSPTTRNLLVVIPWILSVMTFMFPFFHVGGVYGFSVPISRCALIKSSIHYTRFYRVFFSFVSFAVMVVCYVIVLFEVHRSVHRLRRHRIGIALNDSCSLDSTRVARPPFLRSTSGASGSAAHISPSEQLTGLRVNGSPRVGVKTRRADGKTDYRVTKVALTACTVFLICHLPPGFQSFFVTNLSEMQRGRVGEALTIMDWFGIAIGPWIAALVTTDGQATRRGCFATMCPGPARTSSSASSRQ